MKMFLLATLLLAATPCEALSRATSRMEIESATNEAMASFQQAEAADLRFWSSEFASLEDELVRLAALAEAANATKNATATKANASVVLAANATTAAVKVEPVKAAKKHHEAPLIPKHMNLNPKTLADLAPALAMLKGLYEDGKERIAKLNAREKDGKKKFEAKVKEHNDRIARIEAKFANHTLNLEFRTNETRDENRLWAYWSRVRERQHKSYHTGLKIQHATLDKVKNMIDMYEKTMSGHTTEAKKELEKVAPPEIVFLQASVAQFCHEALAELRSSEKDLQPLSSREVSQPPLI